MKAIFRMWSVTDIEIIGMGCLIKRMIIAGKATCAKCSPVWTFTQTSEN